MNAIEPYERRNARFLDVVAVRNWRLKVYALATGSGAVTDEQVATALDDIVACLPQPATTADRYGVGFMIVHRGTLRHWFSLDWWEYEDILFHRLFSSPLEEMAAVTEEESAAMACVHELKIIHFETEAWIDTALDEHGDPGFSRYLAQRFEQ